MAGASSLANRPKRGTLQERAEVLRAQSQATSGPEHPPQETEAPSASDEIETAPNQPPAENQAEEQSGGNVGAGDYVVREGDCIASIAKDTGHFWETLWNDPGNTDLRQTRVDPNVLLPGDRVAVPPLRPKEEPGETELRHRFRRKGEPAMLRLRLLTQDEQPRANQPYTLDIDGQIFEGSTDVNGLLQAPIPGNARRGILTVGPDNTRYELQLGRMDPITEISGVQGRLKNLGYDPGAIDGQLGPRTRSAILRYQQAKGLQETGQPDQQTRDRLLQDHGH